MADILYKAQFALRLCEDHDKKELHAYCKTCDKKICSSCIKEDHVSHDWETIADILREIKRTLPEECKGIREKKLPLLKSEIDRFERKIEKEDAILERNKSVLNTSRQFNIDIINKLFDDRIDECQEKSEATKQIYRDKRDELKQKVEYLETMTTSLDKDIDTLPDHDILDMEKEMRDELENALSYSADKYTCTTVFVPGHVVVQALESMKGEIHNVSLEEMYDINRYSNFIHSVQLVSDTNAWIMLGNDMYAQLLDGTGKVLKAMKTPCFDLVVTRTRGIVLADNDMDKCTISVLIKDEEKIRTIYTKPLHPTWISKTENDDILITLWDSGDQYNLLPTSRRIVQRMTITGKVLNTYEFKEDGKTRLFTWPSRTTENKNTDICVVNSHSRGSGELVVLHRNGHLKFIYRGDGLENEKFIAGDVECDDKCRILFTELYSGAIHALSAEGMYLCTLCQYKHLCPAVISVHGAYLCCGFIEGRVKVFKYKK